MTHQRFDSHWTASLAFALVLTLKEQVKRKDISWDWARKLAERRLEKAINADAKKGKLIWASITQDGKRNTFRKNDVAVEQKKPPL